MAKKKTKKKAAAKKPAKKATKKVVKKAAKKPAAKKAPAKKAKKAVKAKPAKKTAAKKAVKKAAPKKAAPKKAAPKKVVAPKKITAPKAAAPKAAKPAKAQAAASAPAASPSEHTLVGSQLPDLTLIKHDGSDLSLGTLSTGKVVLYFYPKDDTPGCTTQACGFRDNFNRAESAGIRVIGVSPDSTESHKKFVEKYGLNFELLTDTDHKLADELNVWKEKNFMGKTYMGIERSTFLLNNGEIVKAWQPVKVEGHVDEVLAAAESLA